MQNESYEVVYKTYEDYFIIAIVIINIRDLVTGMSCQIFFFWDWIQYTDYLRVLARGVKNIQVILIGITDFADNVINQTYCLISVYKKVYTYIYLCLYSSTTRMVGGGGVGLTFDRKNVC